MPVQLSPELVRELFAAQSSKAMLTLLTLNHPSFAQPIRLVNNSSDVVSRGDVFVAFPFSITMPIDDGETAREVQISMTNVSLDIIGPLRSVTEEIPAKVEIILSNLPDEVQMSMDDLLIRNIQYNVMKITATLALDNFLNTELTSEKYTPSRYPGLF